MFFLLTLIVPFLTWGEDFMEWEDADCCECRETIDVTFRASYYYPLSDDFREIYGDGNVNWGLEIDVPLWCNLDAFLGVDYFTIKGHSTLFHYSTRFTTVPVSLGLQYTYDLCDDAYSLYGAVGGVYTPVYMKDNSPFAVPHRNRGGFGVIGRVGGKVHLYECLFLDIFTDYTWQDFSYKGSNDPYVVGRHVNLSHFKFGGGLTYKF